MLIKSLKRFAKQHLRPSWRAVTYRVCAIRRRRFPACCFIGVTGSSGKTTTVRLIHAVLSQRFPGCTGPEGLNTPWRFGSTLRRVGADHRYCVQEVGLGAERIVRIYAGLLQPRMAVVTHVQSDHLESYGSLEAIAEEKGSLVAALGADGVAILNADDPRVAAMAARTRARVLRFGLGDAAELRAHAIHSQWPEPLRFDASYGGECCAVVTRLHGAHWVHAALAAMACGLGLGMSLREAAAGLALAEPAPSRMEPRTMPDGVTFLRDDVKAPVWATSMAFDVMRNARAPRRIIVLGTLSEAYGNLKVRHRHVALQACESADLVVVISERASYTRRSYDPPDGPPRAFVKFDLALDYLRSELRAGDLVLLKGNRLIDHLERIMLDREKRVACERTRCGRKMACEACRWLYKN